MTESGPRHIGLLAALQLGVGVIVGGGILALAGVAISAAGPAALLAVLLNGLIALLTACSFAEMASKFPESGGAYAFSKKALSVEAAFAVGWVVWFAAVVSAVLYSMGCARFILLGVAELWAASGREAPVWLVGHGATAVLAAGFVLGLSLNLLRKASSGGRWVNLAALAVFVTLVVGGLVATLRRPSGEATAALQPFFAHGLIGLVQAMGYTFIALQGFDLIAAVGGEVRQPARTIPRAMFLSLAIALAIYLPLILVVMTAGVPTTHTAAVFAADHPESLVAIAAERFLGPFGYWLVLTAGVLSMVYAAHATLFAASRIAQAMARDHTLPAALGVLSVARQTPYGAILTTAAITGLLVVLLPDLASAGAAASLIFLVTFALAHWIAILVRQRSGDRPPPFRAPFFPVVPVVGGLTCLALAIFQGSVVPVAGVVVLVWLGLGSLLYLGLFAHRARVRDASTTALDPELVRLRGKSPLILVPVANPHHAPAMVAVAQALAPPVVGRVVLLSVVPAGPDAPSIKHLEAIANVQDVLRESLTASLQLGIAPEALTTLAADPMAEIARVARSYRCAGMLVGLSDIAADERQATPLEGLLGRTDTDIVVLRVPPQWRLADVRRVLIPVGGRGGHEQLLATLLGSLLRTGERRFSFVRVLPVRAKPAECRRAQRALTYLAEGNVGTQAEALIVQSDTPEEEIARRANDSDLVVLGIQRLSRRQKLFGRFTRRLAQHTHCPLVIISSRG